MKRDVGCSILNASPELTKVLHSSGELEQFSAGQILFAVDEANEGVFLIMKGTVCMSLPDAPKLNRLFGPSALLGLPSTFTGKPYSLTAVALATSEVVHVCREEFLDLMKNRPDLCRDATDMLCKETAFLQNALTDRRRRLIEVG